MTTLNRSFFAAVAISPLLACSGPAAQTPPPAPPPTAPSTAPASSALDPVSSRTTAGSLGASEAVTAPGLAFDLPAGWASQPPKSSMRLAQAEIPGPAGSGELTVFYFGPGGGGGVEANLERWIGQVEVDPDRPPRRDSFEVGALRVTSIEVNGTLQPSSMGTGPTTPQPGSLLFGAVVEGDQGPWFFKATGPAPTMEAAREAFLAMLHGLRPAA